MVLSDGEASHLRCISDHPLPVGALVGAEVEITGAAIEVGTHGVVECRIVHSTLVRVLSFPPRQMFSSSESRLTLKSARAPEPTTSDAVDGLLADGDGCVVSCRFFITSVRKFEYDERLAPRGRGSNRAGALAAIAPLRSAAAATRLVSFGRGLSCDWQLRMERHQPSQQSATLGADCPFCDCRCSSLGYCSF
jgi:hypothetical protein